MNDPHETILEQHFFKFIDSGACSGSNAALQRN